MPTMTTVPDYAWNWLQRSRDVVHEIAARLTGGAPAPGFMEGLRPQFTADQFVRDVVIGVVVDVAFGGRVPTRRPAGATWDRGLTWWAAACAGTTPAEFEQRSRPEPVPQPRLFAEPEPPAPPAPEAGRRTPARSRPLDRARMAQALRALLTLEEDGRVPAAEIRALLREIERG
ncbi:MAG TPA: hypothetical protein VNU01_03620 [Egibacteraceae bacterium]|nr:hypothetical protein [Egibacteraceae bacterium]